VTTSAADVRLLGPALLGWMVVAATLGSGATVHGWLAAAALGGAVLLVARQRRHGTGRAAYAGLGLAVVAVCQVAVAGHVLVRESGDLDELASARASVQLVVVVTSDPVARSVSDRDSRRVTARARAVEVTGRGRTGAVHAPVLLVGDERLLSLRWHERVALSARLGPADPGRAEIAIASVTGPPQVRAPPGVVARGAERLRTGLRHAVDAAPADARGLLPGLVIGDTSRTPPDLTDAMLATGMTHLSAVSGANVAVVLGMVLGACSLLGLPRFVRPLLALVALAGFVVLARPDPSVVRAAVMGAIGLLGMSRSRRALGLPVLGAAVVLLLVYDPWLARSYGFALSTLATLGLLVFTRPWGDTIGRRLPGRLRGLGPAVAVPLAAQVMCAPVIVLLQGSVSLIGVLANVLAAPLVPPATVAGVVAAVLSLVSDRLAVLVGTAGAVPTLGIARVARGFADVPGGTMPWPDGPLGAALLATLTVAGVLLLPWLSRRVLRHPVAALGVLALVVGGTVPTTAVTWPPPGWRMVVCDVGQGDASVLRSGPHRAVLVDVGPDPRLVDHCLDRLGIDVLDAVVLTHFHADHVEGLPGALGGRRVGEVLTSPVAEPGFEADQVRRWVTARGIPLRPLALGERISAGEVNATVLSPARRIDAGSVPNNASVVLLARMGEVDALLLGDIEREAAHDLLLRLRRDPALVEAVRHLDVVKVAHHGSANLDPDLVAEAGAPVGIISVGADNDYGHPAPSTLALLRADGYAVYRTDRQGDVSVLDRGGRVLVSPARR
jgi:competence protein ComEC